MYIHNLIKQLRTTEGIIREKLEINDQEWEHALQKYGMWYHNQNDHSLSEKMKITPAKIYVDGSAAATK